MAIRRFIPLGFLFLSLSACGQGVAGSEVASLPLKTLLPDSAVKTVPVRSYTRFEREIRAFEESDRVSPPASGSILFVGSSSIRLWKTVAADMAPMPVLNRGFGGATIGEVNHYFSRIVAKYTPKLLVFYAGENDLYMGMSVDSVLNDFNRFRDSVATRLPHCRMIFIGIKPSPARWAAEPVFLEANARFRTICDKDPAWTYLDVTAAMSTPTGRPRNDIYRADSLHMNAAGYAEWTKLLKPVLKTAWKAASAR